MSKQVKFFRYEKLVEGLLQIGVRMVRMPIEMMLTGVTLLMVTWVEAGTFIVKSK